MSAGLIFRFERNKTALEETLVYFMSFTFIFMGGRARQRGEERLVSHFIHIKQTG